MLVKGMKTLHPKSALSYPAYFNKHAISYEVFPEAWELVFSTLAEHGHEISVRQFYDVIQELDKMELNDEAVDQKVWQLVTDVFQYQDALKVMDVESAVKIRNIAVRRIQDRSLLYRLDTDVVSMLFNFSNFKA